MFYLLVLFGLVAMAASFAIAGFGVTIRETPLGGALLVVASVTLMGGGVLVGLAAAVRELRQMVQAVKALRARTPALATPSRPVERKDDERRDGADRWPAPSRTSIPARQGSASPSNPMPGDLDAPPAPQPPRPRSNPWQERLRRPAQEIESDAKSVEAAAVRRANSRAGDIRPPAAEGDQRTVSGLEAKSSVAHSPPPPLSAEPTASPAQPAPVASAQEFFESQPTLLESQRKIFDMMWPAGRRKAEVATEKRSEALPLPAEHATEIPSTAPSRSAPPARPVESWSPHDTKPARPSSNVPLSAPAEQPAPDQPAILKTGLIEDMAYTLFSDGSIETQTADVTMRFGSIDELRHHLEQRQG